MRAPALVAAAGVAAFAVWLWHAQLFTVARPGAAPRALAPVPRPERRAAAVDVVLPAVPVGMACLRGGDGVLLVHYWAPWERHARPQAAALDSLRRDPALARLRAVVVCFDPFPSVARFLARQRLGLTVLIDGDRALARVLPCPSVPYTYVLDASGRIAVVQEGEVDWLAPDTRATLRRLLEEPPPPPGPGSGATPAS
jgi:hypothetical protein